MRRKTAKRPRRKAKQERSRRTVADILEAAARVLQRRGYAAATTNRIAEAAGVSVGTLYEYFADKEAVFDALIQQQIGAIVAAIRSEGFDPNAPLAVTVDRVLRVAMRAMGRGPAFLRALEQVPGATFRRRLSTAREQVIALVRGLLESHRSELRVDDLGLAAFVVVSAAEGIASNASDEEFGDPLAREVGALLLRYLTGEPIRIG